MKGHMERTFYCVHGERGFISDSLLGKIEDEIYTVEKIELGVPESGSHLGTQTLEVVRFPPLTKYEEIGEELLKAGFKEIPQGAAEWYVGDSEVQKIVAAQMELLRIKPQYARRP